MPEEEKLFRPTDAQYLHLAVAYLAALVGQNTSMSISEVAMCEAIQRESENAAKAYMNTTDVPLSRKTYERMLERLKHNQPD